MIALSLHVSLRQQALRDAQTYGDGADTGEFDAKRRGKKSDAKRKSDVISTSRRLYLRQKSLLETHNSGLGVWEGSGTGGKEKK